MNNTDILVTATKLNKIEDIDNTMIMRSFNERLAGIDSIQLSVVKNNARGLPQVYNEAMRKYHDVRWLLFVHDDVYIDDSHVIDKLNQAHERHGFNIIGLAGCLDPAIKSHNLWHVMATRDKLRGQAAHPSGVLFNGESCITMTSFGPTPNRVALIDGLFMAVHMPTVSKTAWKFNENYTFHHYDLSSCIDANKHRLKIGVVPINVVHTSPGLMSVEDVAWSTSNRRFIEEYGKN